MSESSLSGRHAIVTGAAGGIGSATARKIAEQGAHVTLADVNAEALEQLSGELRDAGLSAQTWTVDLTDSDALAALTLDADILVNNAGLQHIAPLHEFPPEKWQLLHQVMLTAPFLLIRAVLPSMYERGWGRIVNLSSAHGLRASEFKGAYVAAKHGLEGLSKTTALEGAEHGVTSVCINPGYVRTPLIESQIAGQAKAHGIPESQVLSDVMLATQPLKRLAEPEEIADAVAFACSSAATNMTGSNIVLDGGWTAR
ncbi:3-hydroxybutyrate dehydrogenase [Spelaeicoccus albus]|uniref:3-hydroxybutyrate dehydrogenase n=1 Tax=Spelaeicoccus albus TaxID=1280376 RepID=A0A7Z0A7N4_9MICO|nr:3-hydroxybutyrate dehydrogenase [Spelaeicoccus albus]NYI65944.1 3-hydroxybutyrate dehydrogenase [Spelaeicoccus albus]